MDIDEWFTIVGEIAYRLYHREDPKELPDYESIGKGFMVKARQALKEGNKRACALWVEGVYLAQNLWHEEVLFGALASD